MQVRLLFFGALKDLVGAACSEIELSDGATVADLLRLIQQDVPRLAAYGRSMAVSVNQEYATSEKVLRQNDEVAFLPPVSGGAPESPGRVFLVRQRIESEKVIAALKAPPDGAVVVFDGIVRDNSRGRRTLYLDYEAYEQMAVKELEALAKRAFEKFAIRDMRIVHRLGRLEIGETSVLIVVASAHRAAAFDACRWLIDELKRTVPIWKKEYFEDGAVWADGEPFPPGTSVGK